MTTVEIRDVRIALNNIEEEQLADATIQQKIDDAEHLADSKNIEDEFNKRRFIRAYAALKSFVVSNTYYQADFGDIKVRRRWKRILDELENELNDAIVEAGASPRLVIDSTPMFDDRPTDEE